MQHKTDSRLHGGIIITVRDRIKELKPEKRQLLQAIEFMKRHQHILPPALIAASSGRHAVGRSSTIGFGSDPYS